ncbi:MAG: MtrB/PioB family decaheme-associated outer membrane protein [Gemmatimonadales bacterium]|nr:MtrB/PioB family decaheme-associated outer membrane protein [Gemmatimonadales bacterium]
MAQLGLGLFVATARAQGPTASGQIEFGVRTLWDKLARSSSKFSEYEAIPRGLFISQATAGLNWGATGYYVTLRARDALEGDQQVRLRGGRHGRWEFGLEFDRLPHAFSNTGRSIYTQTAPGVFRLPDDVQERLRTISTTDIDPTLAGRQIDTVRLGALVNGLARPVALSLRRERAAATFRYNPVPKWDMKLRYSEENQVGTRPFGATFSFNPSEQPEPINYRTRQFQANLQWSDRAWTVQLGYAGSFFHNRVSALVWDNPFREADVAGNPAAGQIDMYPSNRTHQGTLTAAVSRLPFGSRVTVTAAYGVMLQDDSLLPFTINTAITTAPALPAATASGKLRTLLLSTTAVSRPVRDLTLTFRYRSYERDNQTPSLVFSDYVRTDQTLDTTNRRNLPVGYTRQNAGVEASWRVLSPVSLKAGYDWEGWDRVHRETPSTSERTLGGAVNVDGGRGLFVRASFRRSTRTAHDYEAERVAEEAFPAGEPGLGQLDVLRKFDQASRERSRAELVARVSPLDNLDLSASYSLTDDDYNESAYGMLTSRGAGPSLQATYSPTPRLTLFAEYAHEQNTISMRSRQRTPATATAPVNDKPDNDWVSDVRDRANIYSMGLSGELLPARLRADLSYSVSDGNGLTRTRTPGTPDLVTTARDYPQTTSNLRTARATFTYALARQVDLRFAWRYYRYDEVDYALDPMLPFMGFYDGSSAATVWLGATRPGHRAHVAALSMAYRL